MRYEPSPTPAVALPGFRDWVTRELRRVAGAFRMVNNLTLQPLAAEPAKLQDGMIVYANGTDWNPGSGAGVYAREAGAWVKL